MANLDERKVKLWGEVIGIIWKSIFSIAILIAFFIVLSYFIKAQTTFDAAKYGAIEAFLCGTVYLAFKHYFPATTSSKEPN